MTNQDTFVFPHGKVSKTKFGSYCLNGIAKGCKYCIKGEKLVLFVSGICKTCCVYCPLSNLRKGKDTVWANERECKEKIIEEIIDEAKQSNSLGAGITGGDPLIKLEQTISYAKALKDNFGKDFHLHIYLSTKLVNRENLQKLSEAIDEVRFHPMFLLGAEYDSKEDIKIIKIASDFFEKDNIGIELPIFPNKKREILEFIKNVSQDISFVNLNELEIGDSNFDYITKNYELDKNGYTVGGSISTGLKILEEINKLNLNLKIHLCTAETKNWHQFKNRLLKHEILPFGNKTADGTVMYLAIYEKDNPDFNNLKNSINTKEEFFDEKKKRIIIDKKNIAKFSKKYKIKKVEEYPTYDAIEVEEEFIN